MKISVCGLWHLGSVSSACMASLNLKILGYDPDKKVIDNLNRGIAPISEPGLDKLIKQQIDNNKLRYTYNLNDLRNSDLLWVCFDTPVDENDNADTDYVLNQIKSYLPFMSKNSIVLVSSQLPLGTIRILECFSKKNIKNKINFAYSPENLRLGNAINIFLNPDRIIVGVRSDDVKRKLHNLLKKITKDIFFMRVESAEMTKHAINSFLANSIAFSNEIAVICESYGANAKEVEIGLKSESRIGYKSYLSPGGAFAGGTLARDINFLIDLSNKADKKSLLLNAIKKSNNCHKLWYRFKILEKFKTLNNKKFLILGLAYKTGTDTLRRSESISLAKWLIKNKSKVYAHDNLVRKIPASLEIKFLENIQQIVIKDYDAVILFNNDKSYIELLKNSLKYSQDKQSKQIIFDQNGFAHKEINSFLINYVTVGLSK